MQIKLSDGRKVSTVMAVVKNSRSVILGMPFLRDNDATIHIKDKFIELGRSKYPLRSRLELLAGSIELEGVDENIREILQKYPEVYKSGIKGNPPPTPLKDAKRDEAGQGS